MEGTRRPNIDRERVQAYVRATLAVVAFVLLRLGLDGILGDRSTHVLLIVPVSYAALKGGLGPGGYASLLGAGLTAVFIPRLFDDGGDWVALGLYFFASAGAISLGAKVRGDQERSLEIEAELERRVAERTAELNVATNELESFCYSVAHDMRTPSRAISGNARILLEDYVDDLPPKLAEHLRRIHRAALKQGHLVDSLLAYAKLAKTPVEREAVDVKTMATQVLQDVVKQEGGAATVQVQPGLTARADERMLRTALRAIVENSVRYRKPDHSAHIEVTARGDGSIAVVDDGIGFEMAYVHKVTQPFERLHRDEAFPGVGMGLALVDRIAARHGGRLDVESEPNGGTTVTLNLGSGSVSLRKTADEACRK